MADWGEIFAAPKMQGLPPNPEFLALLPELRLAGCRRVLDAGCGVGRHLLPLAQEGFQVVGVDREASVLLVLQGRLQPRPLAAPLLQADLRRLPVAARPLRSGRQHQCDQSRRCRRLFGNIAGNWTGS